MDLHSHCSISKMARCVWCRGCSPWCCFPLAASKRSLEVGRMVRPGLYSCYLIGRLDEYATAWMWFSSDSSNTPARAGRLLSAAFAELDRAPWCWRGPIRDECSVGIFYANNVQLCAQSRRAGINTCISFNNSNLHVQSIPSPFKVNSAGVKSSTDNASPTENSSSRSGKIKTN